MLRTSVILLFCGILTLLLGISNLWQVSFELGRFLFTTFLVLAILAFSASFRRRA